MTPILMPMPIEIATTSLNLFFSGATEDVGAATAAARQVEAH